MDRMYSKYREMAAHQLEGKADHSTDELSLDLTGESAIDSLGMGVIRKEVELTPDEKKYLLSVERGDIPTVRQFLALAQSQFVINVNCIDPHGRTALLIAIENDNIEMIDLLLGFNVTTHDALLHAINEDNVEATQHLLVHLRNDTTQTSSLDCPANKEKAAKITARWKKLTLKRDASVETTDSIISEGLISTTPVHCSSFTPDITPLILAAHRDNYEIIRILLDRGDRIPKPHDVHCGCADCALRTSEDSLNHSRSRINAYRALSSPSLMALSSKDPILTAFELSWELRLLSRLENELKVEYEQLAKQCQDFAVDLLDQTRGSKELEILLNYDSEGPVTDGGDRMNLARLKLAIKYKQKRFVSHANCQQLLASIWYEGLLGFRRRQFIFKILLTVFVFIIYPILSVIYMIAPKSCLGRFMRRPFIKFICHSASYMTFLFLLILASQRIKSISNLAGGSDVDDDGKTPMKMTREVRGAEPTTIEWMILVYVTGLVWAEVKQLWDQGVKSYIQDMWNILDFMTNSLYIATYALKLVAYLRVKEEIRKGQPELAHAPREQWDAYDPTLISEGLFAAANIFSSLKLIYIFTVNPHLGPLQISLGRMVIDILKFLFIALLVCFSYSCGVNQLYWYYAEKRSRDCADCQKTHTPQECKTLCDRTIANLFEIIQTLYFAVYGLVDINHFELKEQHEFTQFVGKLMFGTYCGIMIIVLINMLIAMLSSSFQTISNDADTEWKFARSRLWMSYFEEGGTVPPPFNIIPTPKTVYYILCWSKERVCRCSKKAKHDKWESVRSVIHDLVKRYILKRQRLTNAEGVNEDDINEIKQDISSFRYELLEILSSNGMRLPSIMTTSHLNIRLRRKANRMSMRSRCSDIVRQSSATTDDAPTDDDDKQSCARTSFLGQDTGCCVASINTVDTKQRRAVFHRSAASAADAHAGPSVVEEFFRSSRDLDESTNWAFESADAETCCLTPSTGRMDTSDDVFSGCDKTRDCPNCGCSGRLDGANIVRSESGINARNSWSAAKKVSFQINDRRRFRDARTSGEDSCVKSVGEAAVHAGEKRLDLLKEKEPSKFWNRSKNANH